MLQGSSAHMTPASQQGGALQGPVQQMRVSTAHSTPMQVRLFRSHVT